MTEPVQQSGTPGGLPYPESTASLSQGANDIKALALALDARLPYKTFHSYAGYSTNATGDVSVATTGISNNAGLVATCEHPNGFYITKMSGANTGVVFFRVFAAGGAVLANGYIVLSLYTWGY